MGDERVREDVVAALVEAHGSEMPWMRLAAVEFEVSPPPTEAEKAQARRTVLDQRAGS